MGLDVEKENRSMLDTKRIERRVLEETRPPKKVNPESRLSREPEVFSRQDRGGIRYRREENPRQYIDLHYGFTNLSISKHERRSELFGEIGGGRSLPGEDGIFFHESRQSQCTS